MSRARNYNQLFWIFHSIGWTIFSISDISRNFDELSKTPAIYYWIFAMFMGFILTFFLRLIYMRIFLKKYNGIQKILFIVCCSILCSTAWMLSNWILTAIVELLQNELRAYVQLIFKYELKSFHFLIRISDAAYPILAWSLLYFGLKTWYDFLNEKQSKEQAHLLAQQAQLQMLRYQINPHFLFNSLNSIQALIYEDQKLADKMLTELSEFLRYSLNYKNRVIISFFEELEITEKYLNIQKTRFEDKIQFHLQVSEEAKLFPVISFILQPIIENAIKYGIQTSSIPLILRINADVINNKMKLTISNTGSWIDNKSKGIGIENIEKRLYNAYQDNYNFDIIKDKDLVTIRMEIPYLTM